jgi:hypothetical protein
MDFEAASQRSPTAPDDSWGGRSILVAAAVNDDEVLHSNLHASPLPWDTEIPLVTERGCSCAGQAYNRALDRSDAEIVIFAHQDVYLPKGWCGKLRAAVEALETRGETWAILGIVGIDRRGVLVGRSWSNGLHQEIDRRRLALTSVQSVDELVIVLRRASGLRFDGELPGFHLYGTDIVQSAIAAGLGAYVFDGPVVHNSLPVSRLDGSYRRAYRYMQRKWTSRLPIETTVVPLTRSGWALFNWRARNWIRGSRRLQVTRRCASPARMAQELGYE